MALIVIILLTLSCASPQLLNPYEVCLVNLNNIYKAASTDNDLEYYTVRDIRISNVKKVANGIYLTCNIEVLLKYKNHDTPIVIFFDFIVRLFNRAPKPAILGNANA